MGEPRGCERGDLLPIRGRGVVIDALRADDAAVLAASHSDPETARYQGWETPLSIEAAGAFIAANLPASLPAPGTGVQLAIRRTDGGRLVGDLYLAVAAGEPDTLVVGLTVVPGEQRRGVGAAAVRAVSEATALGSAGIRRLRAEIDVENVRSRRLFESLGFSAVSMASDASTRRDGSTGAEVTYELGLPA